MRILVHYHAYGVAATVPGLITEHGGRIRKLIDLREEDEVGRLEAEYQPHTDRLGALHAELADARARQCAAKAKGEEVKAAAAVAKVEKQREKVDAKVSERDERIAEARRRAEDDREAVSAVGAELITLYADPDELLKHARVVRLDEIEENEFNLNIPRYVDTFEPEPWIEVEDALKALGEAEAAVINAEAELKSLLQRVGYDG
jgi:type I restriction enzyme M protein